jgi:hypothetical protein
MAQNTSKKFIVFSFLVLLTGTIAGGIYLADVLYYKPLREQKQLISNLKTVVQRLTKVQRLADIVVIEQTPLRTKFNFLEIDDNGNPIGAPRVFDIEGDEAYFDTLVIEFKGTYDPNDDGPLKETEVSQALTGHSIILFRRVFGSKQKPEEGIPLDADKSIPTVYRSPYETTPLEEKLWNQFWELANDPVLAKNKGVTYASGSAAYTKLLKGNIYHLEKRTLGAATLRAEVLPAILR